MKEWEKGWKIILYSDNCPDEFSGDCEYNRETDIDHVKCSEDICPRKPDASKQPVEAKCGCKHEDRFDCEYMDENKNCAINKKG